MPTVHLYWTDQWRMSSGDVDVGKDALDNAVNQLENSGLLNVDIDIRKEHELSGDWGSCEDYDNYTDEFDKQIYQSYGHGYFLLYHEPLLDGFSYSDPGRMGTMKGAPLDHDTHPMAITNIDLDTIDERIYRNTVMQEFLHMLSVGHDDGEQYENWYGKENSPMVTGYAESRRGGNPMPDYLCDVEETTECNYHNGSLSSCAIGDAVDHLNSTF
jgi:hypothetical protein